MKKQQNRFALSRHTICAIVVFLEVLLMAAVIFAASVVSYVFFILALIVDVVTVLVIVNQDANPDYKVSWIVVVMLMPLLGALLYAIFYRRSLSKREVRLIENIYDEMGRYKGDDSTLVAMGEENPVAAGKARAILNADRLAELYSGSASTYFPTGEEYFESLIADLKEARSFIFLEYFIVRRGDLWGEIHRILKEKVAEGVEVRMLFDDFGCMRNLPPYYELNLRADGIKAHTFNRLSTRMDSSQNNRDHRKICVIDGKIGYTGGVNLADEYVNRIVRFGYWKDGGIRVTGSAVGGLMKHFLSIWSFTVGVSENYDGYFAALSPTAEADGGYYLPFASGPVPIYERSAGKHAFLNMINQAKNYIYVTTPYLVIDYEMTEAFCNAALRGVDVRIITPGIPDHKEVKIVTKSNYPHLMEAGVKIYEYLPGIIHSKNVVCDDEYAVVGTINFDYRSLAHHFEDAVWMYNTPTISAVKEDFLTTVEQSAEVDEKRARLTPTERIVKIFIKLFSPLL